MRYHYCPKKIIVKETNVAFSFILNHIALPCGKHDKGVLD
jgi:hypothetical protein